MLTYVFALIDPFWGTVFVAAIGFLGTAVGYSVQYLEKRHTIKFEELRLANEKAMAQLEEQNSSQHARGYSLLESIDHRTQAIHEMAQAHGEWIAGHEMYHKVTDGD